MTSANATITEWSAHPLGRAARIGIGVVGLGLAMLLLMTATVAPSAGWAFVVTGVLLTAVTVRAAERPTLIRLASLLALVVVAPYLTQLV
jgi:hypothetical protein